MWYECVCFVRCRWDVSISPSSSQPTRQIVSGKSAFEHTGHRGGLTNAEKQRKKNFVMVRSPLFVSVGALGGSPVRLALCSPNEKTTCINHAHDSSSSTGAEGEALRLLQAPRHAAGPFSFPFVDDTIILQGLLDTRAVALSSSFFSSRLSTATHQRTPLPHATQNITHNECRSGRPGRSRASSPSSSVRPASAAARKASTRMCGPGCVRRREGMARGRMGARSSR